jgi:hypothetical protein
MSKSKSDDAPGTHRELTPIERMRDLTRRIVSVPKSELPKPKPAKSKRHRER